MLSRHKQVTSPSRKDPISQPQIERPSHSDPLNSINIQELLRKEAEKARRESESMMAENAILKSQVQRLTTNELCKDMFDRLDSSRQQAEAKRTQDLADMSSKLKLEFQRFKKQAQDRQMDKLVFPTDSFILKQPSNSAAIEVKGLNDKIKLLTDTNKRLLEQMGEAKNGSQASRTLEAEFTDLRNKLNGYEKQLAEKDDSNRTLTDELSTLRKKTTDFDREMAAKKQAIKRLSGFIKRLFGLIQSNAPNDRKMANPAKGISEGAEIDANKLQECEKYAGSVLQSLKEAISKYSSTESSSAVEIGRLNDQIETLRLQKDTKQDQLKQEQSKTFSLTNKISGLQERLKQESSLRTTAQAANAKLSSSANEQKTTLQSKNKALTASVDQLQRQKKQNLAKMKTQTDKIDELELSLKKLRGDMLKIQADLDKKTTQVQKAKTTITNLEGDKKALGADLAKTKKDLNTANDNIMTKTTRISGLEESQRKLKDEVRNLRGDIKGLEANLKDASAKFAKAESDISSLNTSLSREKEDHKKSLGVIDNINKMMIAEASQKITGKTVLLQRTSPNESDKLQKEIQVLLGEWVSSFRAAQFFNGSLIIPRESVSWMVETLNTYTKQVPSATRLVHRFDPLNSTNFHQYIDGVPNLLVLIHLSNGAKIGGFTVCPVLKDPIQQPGRGFIFSITDSKAYYMRKQPRKAVVNYDEYYLILGNADIRLRQQKIQQKQKAFIFSSFGISSSTFDNQGDSRAKFLKMSDNSNNDQSVDSFEFYEVIFER